MFYKIRLLSVLAILFMAIDSGSLLQAKANPQAKRFNLSICTLFNNEAPYLDEWIEYHHLLGVDHFYLYNSGSTDNYKETLLPYIQKGMVTLVEWPAPHLKKDEEAIWALSSQIPAYENALKLRAEHETKWLVFLDVNEFIVPALADSLPTILEAYGDKAGVTLCSDCYDGGSKKHLMIESCVRMRAPKPQPHKEVSKTIFKPQLTKGFIWPPYQCRFKENLSPVRVSKAELKIHRYLNRTDEMVQRLRDRLEVDSSLLSDELMSELLNDGYELEDQNQPIARFVSPLLQKLNCIR